jgi:hypothetical protein
MPAASSTMTASPVAATRPATPAPRGIALLPSTSPPSPRDALISSEPPSSVSSRMAAVEASITLQIRSRSSSSRSSSERSAKATSVTRSTDRNDR